MCRCIVDFRESEPSKYNHGDGRGLVSQPFDLLTGLPIINPARTSLYRHFDVHDNLLYVGISLNAMARMSQHTGAYYTWTEDVATMKIEWFESRELALAAEKIAIKKEKPRHNIIHNKDH